MSDMTAVWTKLMAERPADAALAKQRLAELPTLAMRCGFTDGQQATIAEYGRGIAVDEALFSRWAAALAIFAELCPDDILDGDFPPWLHDGMPMEAFLLTIAIAEIPAGEDMLRRRGLPVGKIQEALQSLRSWVCNCERNYGVTGLRFDHGFAWIALRLLPGIVLRFGSLEYNQSRAFGDILVFRNRTTGEIAVMMDGAMAINPQGRRAAIGDDVAFQTFPAGGCFGNYIGNTIARDGRVLPDKLNVRDEDWECVLRPWDPVLYMHIPESGGLMPEAVQASYQDVAAFYARPDSDFHPKAIISSSWLFDPVLQTLLPESANLCSFQRTGWLLPPVSQEHEEIYRVFGAKAAAEGIHAVPWKTGLQKALGAYLDNGGVFRGARFLKML